MREQFLLLKQQDDRKSCNGSDDVVKWHVIDAAKSIIEVHESIVKITNEVIDRLGSTSDSTSDDSDIVSIKKLWIN